MSRGSLADDFGALRARWRGHPRRLWLLYVAVFLVMGAGVQLALPTLNIARWARPWQFATLYGFFLVPLAIALRGEPWHRQYAYFVTTIMPLELVAFTLGTSLPYPQNILDPTFGERNFTLALVMIDSWIPYVGNRIVDLLWRRLEATHSTGVESAWGADG